MGKYKSSAVKKERPPSEGPHVIWRGIGCLSILIIPAISIAAGIETVKYALANGWVVPYELLGYITLPEIFRRSTGLWAIFGPLTRINHLYAYIVASIIYMVAIGGVTSVIYAIAYRFIGPPRYGPLDIPPPKVKTKKYTR
jgi:hypothetical protein